MQQSKYQVFPGEYDCYVVNPLDQKLYSVVTGKPIPGAPVGVIGGSACLHHFAFIAPDKSVWVLGNNANNISATGIKDATIGATKTPVTNAAQVVAYANGGDPTGLGYGTAVLTADGKVILLGNTQSGFRGDGTEGNAAEPAPYTVQLAKPIQKIVGGTYLFALSTDGTVYRWGGTRKDPYWAQFSCGAFTSSPDLLHIGNVALPEPIVDIVGGADWSYAIGKSGRIYGWAYSPMYLGLPSGTASKLGFWDLTGTLNLGGMPAKLTVGPEASYALMANGDLYAWGNNTQAAIGNGKEGTFANFQAPWGVQSNSLWVLTPTKVNPAGVSFVNIFTSIGDAFYAYAEDSNANLWVWGRNKGYVLWNGIGGTPDQQSAQPNMWDVLSPTKIKAFGPVTSVPPVVVDPPPPVVNAPRTVSAITLSILGQDIVVQAAQIKQIKFNDGTIQ